MRKHCTCAGRHPACPYTILGVHGPFLKQARTRYVDLCKQLHPDVNGAASAPAAFRAVSTAWTRVRTTPLLHGACPFQLNGPFRQPFNTKPLYMHNSTLLMLVGVATAFGALIQYYRLNKWKLWSSHVVYEKSQRAHQEMTTTVRHNEWTLHTEKEHLESHARTVRHRRNK